ncbi:MAG: 50S ribosomal protein L22 [Candidatus Mycalebacterium zealandia]|nr:MAG: 50S ribosomal protein L22 [Candidatus Mycalebacterium zealandia]
MVSKSILKYYRMSPDKVRLVLALIRGKNVEEAFSVLHLTRKRVSLVLADLLKSAVANASEKGYSEPEELYIKETYADEGPVLKRFKARAMGRAFQRKRKTSHVTIVLERKGM